LPPTLNSFNLQWVANVSLLSCICVIVIFIRIGVRPISIRVFILFDEKLHSGTYVGIRRSSQTVIGSCFRGLLTSTWSARQFFCCHLLGSLTFHDSFRFSYSTFCKELVASSISGGRTTGSSRQGPIAQHKALSTRLVKSESPWSPSCVSSPNVFVCETPLMYSLPVSRCPHLRNGCVACWPESAWHCPQPGLPHLRFHYTLGCHRRKHSQELCYTYTCA
jgi:hypothetical protein